MLLLFILLLLWLLLLLLLQIPWGSAHKGPIFPFAEHVSKLKTNTQHLLDFQHSSQSRQVPLRTDNWHQEAETWAQALCCRIHSNAKCIACGHKGVVATRKAAVELSNSCSFAASSDSSSAWPTQMPACSTEKVSGVSVVLYGPWATWHHRCRLFLIFSRPIWSHNCHAGILDIVLLFHPPPAPKGKVELCQTSIYTVVWHRSADSQRMMRHVCIWRAAAET